jgi:hypothetical protein
VLQTPSKEFFGETEQAQKTSLAQVQIAATLPSPPELNSAAKKSLESWFPLRKPLLRSRAGSGRPTSKRTFKLQLRSGGIMGIAEKARYYFHLHCVHYSKILNVFCFQGTRTGC